MQAAVTLDSSDMKQSVLAANQLLDLNPTPRQLLNAANRLLQLSVESPSPYVLKTVHKLLSVVPGNQSISSHASGPPEALEYKSPLDKDPRPMFLDTRANIVVSSSKGGSLSRHKATSAAPTRAAKASLATSRIASLAHPSLQVPRLVSGPRLVTMGPSPAEFKDAPRNHIENMTSKLKVLTLNSASDYTYTPLWIESNTGAIADMCATENVDLQVSITPLGSPLVSVTNFIISLPIDTYTGAGLLSNTRCIAAVNPSWGTEIVQTGTSVNITITPSGQSFPSTGLIVYLSGLQLSAMTGQASYTITETPSTGSAIPTSLTVAIVPLFAKLQGMFFTTAPGATAAVQKVSPGSTVYVNWSMLLPTGYTAYLFWNSASCPVGGINVTNQGVGLVTYPSPTVKPNVLGITVNNDTIFTVNILNISGTNPIVNQLQGTIYVASLLVTNNTWTGTNTFTDNVTIKGNTITNSSGAVATLPLSTGILGLKTVYCIVYLGFTGVSSIQSQSSGFSVATDGRTVLIPSSQTTMFKVSYCASGVVPASSTATVGYSSLNGLGSVIGSSLGSFQNTTTSTVTATIVNIDYLRVSGPNMSVTNTLTNMGTPFSSSLEIIAIQT
jgi:hypothetical protein